MSSPLRDRLRAAGAAFTEVAEHDVVRDFGDPSAEYAAVRNGAGIAQRGDLVRLRMTGRDPVKMMHGLITNDLAGAADGRGVYAAMLTPKGRTVAELRAFRTEADGGTQLLLDFPAEAARGAREHLKKFVPPLFARWQDVTDEVECIGVYGPAAVGLLRGALLAEVPARAEDSYVEVEWEGEPLLVARTLYAGLEDGYDLFVPSVVAARVWDALTTTGGARPIGFAALETLRIEAGRPRYGHELSEEVIPTEAYQETGLLERAISFTKGCYTGQEVIIRIAHRGHVNRHLRGLLLGDQPIPQAKQPLHDPDSGKPVGWVTSATRSPLLSQTIALAFVRREIDPGKAVHLGTQGGSVGIVVRLPFDEAAR
jgi:folate-binding protein YgfZ